MSQHEHVNNARFSEQLGAVIQRGLSVPLRPPENQYTIGPMRVEPGPFAAWRSQATHLLASWLPMNHSYVSQFNEAATPQKQNDPAADHRDAGVGVLQGLMLDVEAGYLTGLRQLVVAEVFGDFLSMAEHLDGQNYSHAAASLAGAVLEDALRRVVSDAGRKPGGSLESLAQVALDLGLLGPTTYKQVKVWIDLRNGADHGNWDQVPADQVSSFVRDLPGFLATTLNFA